MSGARADAIFRVFLAVLVVTAIATQFTYSLTVLHSPAVNFFSYFTIETNLIVVVGLLVPHLSLLRGAATMYIVIVGIVYALLLAGIPDSTIPWVNIVLHDVTPLAMTAYWLLAPARIAGSSASVIARWLVYPLAFLAYSLIRGVIIGWYPYPFLDPRTGGYGHVAVVCIGIVAGGVLLSAAIIAYGRYRVNAQGRRTITP